MALWSAALNGLGLALLPTYCIGQDLTDKSLIEVLPSHTGPEEQISVLYPHRRFLPAKSRLFIDFMADSFRRPPWERRPAARA
jgi:DNA-binding transcriptional LysR family regulator